MTKIPTQRIAKIVLAHDEAQDGGQCGPVLVSFYDEQGEFYMPHEVEHGDDLVGFEGTEGMLEVMRLATELFPNAKLEAPPEAKVIFWVPEWRRRFAPSSFPTSALALHALAPRNAYRTCVEIYGIMAKASGRMEDALTEGDLFAALDAVADYYIFKPLLEFRCTGRTAPWLPQDYGERLTKLLAEYGCKCDVPVGCAYVLSEWAALAKYATRHLVNNGQEDGQKEMEAIAATLRWQRWLME